MAEEKKEEKKAGKEGKEGEKKKGLPIKLIAIGAVALLAIGGGAFFFLNKGSSDKKADTHEEKDKGAEGEGGEKEEGEGKEEHTKKGESGEKKEEQGGKKEEGQGGGEKKGGGAVGDIFDLDPFVVNLADTAESRFVKVTIKLKLADAGASEEINKELPSIRDSLLILLSSKEFNSIRTVQGKLELRDEILERINTALNAQKVSSVYFTEFVVQ